MQNKTLKSDDARLRRLVVALRECCKTLYEIKERKFCDADLVRRDYNLASVALEKWEEWERAEPDIQGGDSNNTRAKQFDKTASPVVGTSALLAELEAEHRRAGLCWEAAVKAERAWELEYWRGYRDALRNRICTERRRSPNVGSEALESARKPSNEGA